MDTLYSTVDPNYAWLFLFNSDGYDVGSNDRLVGFTVRPVREN